MKAALYLETSVVSYLAARPSRNVIVVDRIEKVCQSQGFNCPVICTPEELIGE